jgi:predicted RNA-binding protein with PUA domain
MDEVYEYRKTNREKKLTPKHGLVWCPSCDVNVVSLGAKCRVCGSKVRKSLKKECYA